MLLNSEVLEVLKAFLLSKQYKNSAFGPSLLICQSLPPRRYQSLEAGIQGKPLSPPWPQKILSASNAGEAPGYKEVPGRGLLLREALRSPHEVTLTHRRTNALNSHQVYHIPTPK